MGQDAEEIQALAFEAAPGEFGDVIQFVGGDFVEDDADDFDALAFEDRLVEINLVNRFADAALADDDDFCAEDFGHLRVGQIKNRADAGVARAFAQDKILFPGDAVKGLDDFFDQGFVVGGLQVFAGEIRLHRNGTHIHQRAIEPIDLVHQHRVLIYFLFFDFDKALADGFDVADAGIKFLQGGQQPEGGGGFPLILTGRGNENAGRD